MLQLEPKHIMPAQHPAPNLPKQAYITAFEVYLSSMMMFCVSKIVDTLLNSWNFMVEQAGKCKKKILDGEITCW